MYAEQMTSSLAEDPADEAARATSERLGPSATAANRAYGDWGETFATAERQHSQKWQHRVSTVAASAPAPPQGAPS